MKAPAFWQHKNLIAAALLPFAGMYALGGKWFRSRVTPETLPVPIICVGNLTAGGSGKTPAAIAIGDRLKQKNIRAAFLSRGYGGALTGPVKVDAAMHCAADVGDEPLLLARTLPTYVAKDRLAGAKAAIADGAELIVMDDGFQNPSIHKTLSLLVINSATVFGNGWLIPAGPLREPVAAGLARADAVLLVGTKMPKLPVSLPIIKAHIEPAESAHALSGKTVVAFCGIAFPDKFFSMLTLLGADVVEQQSFGDHHHYRPRELEALATLAASHHALLVTTAKDAARLSREWRARVTVVDISLVIDDADALDTLLDNVSKKS